MTLSLSHGTLNSTVPGNTRRLSRHVMLIGSSSCQGGQEESRHCCLRASILLALPDERYRTAQNHRAEALPVSGHQFFECRAARRKFVERDAVERRLRGAI
jgi:hypothetical protein